MDIKIEENELTFILKVLQKEFDFSFDISPLQNDASARSYFRVTPYDPNELSCIVMDLGKEGGLPENPEDYPFWRVQQLLARHQVLVPQIYNYWPRENFIILEDGGDTTLESYLKNNSKPDLSKVYRAAVDEIIKIQTSANFDEDRECPAFNLAFDEEKLKWELDFFRVHTVEGYLGHKIVSEDRARLEEFFTLLAKRLASMPRVLTHRDFHSRNLMWRGDRLMVLDFQDARLGPRQYDLVSLSKDAYVDIPDDFVDEMINYYYWLADKLLPSLEKFTDFMVAIEIMTVQRSLKAAGTFGSQYVLKGNQRYLQYLPTVLSYAQKSAERVEFMTKYMDLFDKYFKV